MIHVWNIVGQVCADGQLRHTLEMSARPSHVLLAGLLACGCSGSGEGGPVGGMEAALRGRTFVSESVEGWQLVAGTEVRLRFRDQELSAGAGCNSINARFSIIDNTLSVPGYGITSMGCGSAFHAQDEWLVNFLRAKPRLELTEPRLKMTTSSAQMTLLDREIASPDRPLIGTQWRGDGFSDGNVASGPGSPNITAYFGDNGTVSIATGCQTGTGKYFVDGSKMTFEGFAYDGVACSDPNMQRSHDQVLLVLDGGAVGFEIEEVRLAIHRGMYTQYFRAAN